MEKELRVRDFFKKIELIPQKIKLHSKFLSEEFTSGPHPSSLKGGGIEFEEHRSYHWGDDFRLINWAASKRLRTLIVKVFKQEREIEIILLLDLSGSMDFASSSISKKEILLDLAAVVGFLGIKNGDRVGMIGFTDKIELDISSCRQESFLIQMLGDVWFSEFFSKKTDIHQVLNYLIDTKRRPCLVFLVSDFLIGRDFLKPLAVASAKHEIIPIIIRDKRELEIPDLGLVRVKDIESRQSFWLDTSSKKFRQEFSRVTSNERERKISIFKKLNLNYLAIPSGADLDHLIQLIMFLLKRRNK